MKEEGNILRIFEETKKAIQTEEVIKLRELSDQTIHTASITQDPDNIAVAVIVYSLSKIIQRKSYHNYPGWNNFFKKIISSIDNSILYLKKKDDKNFKSHLELITKTINGLSGNLKKNVQDVFRKARINKASRIYEHGISMEQTAKLLGITMFELAGYAGQTEISDVPLGKTRDSKSRIKFTLEMFE